MNAAGAVGLAAAIDYLTAIGWDKLHAQEVALTDFALQGLRAMPYVHVIGAEKAEDHCGILTFIVDGVTTTSAPFWTRRMWPFVPDTIAPSR